MFYLSEYLESHRDEYYTRLKAISAEGDWNGWIAFLTSGGLWAQQNSERVVAIRALYEEMKQAIGSNCSQYTVQVLDAIFDRPIFSTTDLIARTQIQKPTAMSLIRHLKTAEILQELKACSGRRAAVLCFPRLLNIAEGRRIL